MIELNNYLFDPYQKPIHQQTLITCQGKIFNTVGSFSVLSGMPKARKTTINLGILFSLLSDKEVFGFKSKNVSNAIYIDTEQTKADMYRNFHYCSKITGIKPNLDNAKIFLFRTLDPEEIIQRINEIIITLNPAVIFIDSLTDLVNNINDILEVKQLMNFIKNWTSGSGSNLSIISLIHNSKNSGFTLGNLGSFTDRLAQSVINCKKDPNNSNCTILESKLMRSDADFDSYSLNFTNEDYTLADDFTKPTGKSLDPIEINFSTHLDFIAQLDSKGYTYTELYKELKNKYSKGDNWTKQKLIPFLMAENYITKKEDKKYYSSFNAKKQDFNNNTDINKYLITNLNNEK